MIIAKAYRNQWAVMVLIVIFAMGAVYIGADVFSTRFISLGNGFVELKLVPVSRTLIAKILAFFFLLICLWHTILRLLVSYKVADYKFRIAASVIDYIWYSSAFIGALAAIYTVHMEYINEKEDYYKNRALILGNMIDDYLPPTREICLKVVGNPIHLHKVSPDIDVSDLAHFCRALIEIRDYRASVGQIFTLSDRCEWYQNLSTPSMLESLRVSRFLKGASVEKVNEINKLKHICSIITYYVFTERVEYRVNLIDKHAAKFNSGIWFVFLSMLVSLKVTKVTLDHYLRRASKASANMRG